MGFLHSLKQRVCRHPVLRFVPATVLEPVAPSRPQQVTLGLVVCCDACGWLGSGDVTAWVGRSVEESLRADRAPLRRLSPILPPATAAAEGRGSALFEPPSLRSDAGECACACHQSAEPPSLRPGS